MGNSNEQSELMGLRRGMTNYGYPDFSLYLHRSFARTMGYSSQISDHPVVGIVDSTSGLNNCRSQIPEMIEAFKRDVLAARGLPVVFPTMLLGGPYLGGSTNGI